MTLSLLSILLTACDFSSEEPPTQPDQQQQAAPRDHMMHGDHGDHAMHGDHAGHGDHAMHGEGHAGHEGMAASEPMSGHSVYQLTSVWTDQSGEELKLETLAGKPQVLAMVYTHCEHACPRIIGDMRSIRTGLGDSADEVGFVLVSIDPERDTVDRMATFAKETGIDEIGWRVLRGSDSDIRELAAVLGVQYKRVSESDFAHSNLIHVLDAQGELVHRQEGLGTAPDKTIVALKNLLASAGGSAEG